MLDRVPASVVILGGGVIGVEFASVWRSFGAEVTIVEMLPHLLPAEDESSSKLLERAFRRRGIGYKLGARFEGVKDTGTGVTVTLEGGTTLDADLLLVAVGRGPVVGRPRLRGRRGVDGPRLRHRGRVLPDQRADDLRGRRPHPGTAAGPRRVRRGHPGRRAARRAAGHADRLRRGAAGHLQSTPRSRRSASPPPPRPSGASRPPRSPTTWPATARARSCRPRARPRSSRPRAAARCSASTWSAPGGRADRRGPADLQLGGAAGRGRAAHPSASDPVRDARRGAPGARRQAPPLPFIRSHGSHVGLGIHAPARRERHRGHCHALAEAGRRASRGRRAAARGVHGQGRHRDPLAGVGRPARHHRRRGRDGRGRRRARGHRRGGGAGATAPAAESTAPAAEHRASPRQRQPRRAPRQPRRAPRRRSRRRRQHRGTGASPPRRARRPRQSTGPAGDGSAPAAPAPGVSPYQQPYQQQAPAAYQPPAAQAPAAAYQAPAAQATPPPSPDEPAAPAARPAAARAAAARAAGRPRGARGRSSACRRPRAPTART